MSSEQNDDGMPTGPAEDPAPPAPNGADTPAAPATPATPATPGAPAAPAADAGGGAAAADTDVRYGPNLTLVGLLQELNNTEALFLKLKALTTDAGDTIGTFAQVNDEFPQLRLLLDPGGNVPAPAGTTLVCRGKAAIQGAEQNVAAFRPNG
jgi:hypothetical protein